MRRVIHVVTLLLLASQTTGCFRGGHGRHHGAGPGFGFFLWAPAVAAAVAVAASAPPAPEYGPPPPPTYAPPPPTYAPPPPTFAPPPPTYAPPPPTYAPPPEAQVPSPPSVVAPNPPPQHEGPAVLAVKYAPGASAAVALDRGLQVGTPAFAHSVGLEVRLTRWLALRSDYELRSEGRTWDLVGVKLSPPTSWALKPYLSVSVSGSEAYALPGKYQLGAAAALGLDLFIGRHFFIEAEARYRVTPSDCCREVPHLTALAGVGVAFF